MPKRNAAVHEGEAVDPLHHDVEQYHLRLQPVAQMFERLEPARHGLHPEAHFLSKDVNEQQDGRIVVDHHQEWGFAHAGSGFGFGCGARESSSRPDCSTSFAAAVRPPP